MGKPTKSTKNGRLWVEISTFVRFEFGSVHNYRRPTMEIPELQWCLTEISKCVI